MALACLQCTLWLAYGVGPQTAFSVVNGLLRDTRSNMDPLRSPLHKNSSTWTSTRHLRFIFKTAPDLSPKPSPPPAFPPHLVVISSSQLLRPKSLGVIVLARLGCCNRTLQTGYLVNNSIVHSSGDRKSMIMVPAQMGEGPPSGSQPGPSH